MERHCPACGNPLARNDIVCSACRARIAAREPVRRASVLYGLGRGLMVVFAVGLFAKAAFATFGPAEYGEVARAFGIRPASPTERFLNAAFMAAAALIYAIAWAASFVGRPWDRTACLAALAVFLVGQAVTRVVAAAAGGGWAQALAMFCVWVCLPIFQYFAFTLGRPDQPAAPPDAPAAEPATH